MKAVMTMFTDAEMSIYRAEFEFAYTICGLDCREANQRAYDKVMRKRAIAQQLADNGQTH